VSWQNRPLDRVYPVLLIDAIVVKIRDGQVANRPIYVAMGINLDGERDVLGLWVGPDGGEAPSSQQHGVTTVVGATEAPPSAPWRRRLPTAL
jgi:putative transposase